MQSNKVTYEEVKKEKIVTIAQMEPGQIGVITSGQLYAGKIIQKNGEISKAAFAIGDGSIHWTTDVQKNTILVRLLNSGTTITITIGEEN